MYVRKIYIDSIRRLIGKDVIKIITGMRRVGKSCIMRQLIDELKANGVKTGNILYIDKELLEWDSISDYRKLAKEVERHFGAKSGRKYLFIDEVQEISQWEKAILSLSRQTGMDITLTGSNAHMLSSELATLLSGRYMEFSVYSFGLSELMAYGKQGLKETLSVGSVHSARDNSSSSLSVSSARDNSLPSPHENAKEVFRRYLRTGGLPGIQHLDDDENLAYQYIGGIYDTIILKDVVRRYQIRNVTLLENLTRFIFDNIGNIVTAKRIADYMKSQKISIGVETVLTYIAYLRDALLLYKVRRYDLKGKRHLEIYEKYYLSDIGLRHALLGYREGDISGLLENIVYLELLRRGYSVSIGKWDNLEIDFVAERDNEKMYLQVAYLLADGKTVEREAKPLRAISDNYPKYILSMDELFGSDIDGIKRVNLIEWLLSN